MAQRLENSTPNPALFLLALLKNGNATIRLDPGELVIGPAETAKRLAPKIIEHKKNLIRLLLDQDCAKCGLQMCLEWPKGSKAKAEPKKMILRRRCVACGYFIDRQLPDFPVYDKTGMEV